MLAKDKVKEFMRSEALKPESVHKMPTMRQLTKQLKVSLVTVTRAIKELELEGVVQCRHGSGIVAARKSRIEANLKDDGKSGASSLILAVVDHPSDIIWNRVYMTEQYARQKGMKIINCKVHQDTTPFEIIDFAQKQDDCAGLILMLGAAQLSGVEMEAFSALNHPVVIMNSMFEYEQLPDNVYMVGPDPAGAGRMVAEYLYEKGHRNIGLIRNEPATEYSESYMKSAMTYLREAEEKSKLHYFPSIIRNWGSSRDEARRITSENIDRIRENDITAIIYLSGEGAYASINILIDAGLRLPEDISIIAGFDGWFCEYSRPEITATSVDCRKMCFTAVDIVTGRKGKKEHYYKISENMTERKSVKQIN